MKAIAAAILLLLQLQPVLGAAACASLGRASAQSECAMPEHGSKPVNAIGEPSAPVVQSCAFASLCAPAALAVPEIGDQSATAAAPGTAPLVAPRTSPVGIATAPPLPPPRA